MNAIRTACDSLAGIVIMLVILAATAGAYVQHFITTVANEQWVLMVLGAIIPLVGMLHGWLLWLGVL